MQCFNAKNSSKIDVIKKSVSLARSSVRKCGKPNGYVLVGGSIGPYGACQHDGSEYTGAYIQQV